MRSDLHEKYTPKNIFELNQLSVNDTKKASNQSISVITEV